MAGGKRHLWGVRFGFDIADTDLTDHRQRDLMNAMRFMHYSVAWTVDGR